jgi:Fe-S cluster biogenesis protein NfuA
MTSENSLREQVEASLNLIRPRLQADGGDVQLVDVNDEGVVSVELQGACRGCPGAIMTLKMGIERILVEQVPGVKSVESV